MSGNGDIPVSLKHGLNPTVVRCFWCGEDTNTIALLGKLPNDEQAPRSAVVDYQPCDDCRSKMESGICIAEATDTPVRDDFPPIQKRGGISLYPTGRWAVLNREVLEKSDFIQPLELKEHVLREGKCFISPGAWRNLGLPVD